MDRHTPGTGCFHRPGDTHAPRAGQGQEGRQGVPPDRPELSRRRRQGALEDARAARRPRRAGEVARRPGGPPRGRVRARAVPRLGRVRAGPLLPGRPGRDVTPQEPVAPPRAGLRPLPGARAPRVRPRGRPAPREGRLGVEGVVPEGVRPLPARRLPLPRLPAGQRRRPRGPHGRRGRLGTRARPLRLPLRRDRPLLRVRLRRARRPQAARVPRGGTARTPWRGWGCCSTARGCRSDTTCSRGTRTTARP